MTRTRPEPDPTTSCELHPGARLSQHAVDTLIECGACGAQVPASTATALEGADYLWHFCGHDCLSRWCEKVEQEELAIRDLPYAMAASRSMTHEGLRIEFLLRRDGLAPTLAWVRRTLRIYRAAALNKGHFASTDAYRRRFIGSYCDFKRWLTRMRADAASHELMRG